MAEVAPLNVGPSTVYTSLNNPDAMDILFAGALEAHYVTSCSQLPSSGTLTFAGVQVQGINPVQWLAPSWLPNGVTGLTPDCRPGASATGGTTSTATVQWSPCASNQGQACGACGTITCSGDCFPGDPINLGYSCDGVCDCGAIGVSGKIQCDGSCLADASLCAYYCAGGG